MNPLTRTEQGIGHRVKTFEFKIKAARQAMPDELAIINRDYALEPLTAEQVYVCEMNLANDQVDRDNEKFPVEVLREFALTLPGKSFLFNHERDHYGRGRYLSAEVVEEGGVSHLATKHYMLASRYPDVVEDIKAGIARFVSIGFLADWPIPIYSPEDDPKAKDRRPLYWEYGLPAEALEGSLVWLGAQYDAQIKALQDKQAKNDRKPDTKGAKMNTEELIKQCQAICQQCITACEACMADPDCPPEMMEACKACIPGCQACVDGGIVAGSSAAATTTQAKIADEHAKALRAEREKAAEAYCDLAIAGGQLPPAQKESVRKLYLLDPDVARDLVKSLPNYFKVSRASAEGTVGGTTAGENGLKITDLTPEEQAEVGKFKANQTYFEKTCGITLQKHMSAHFPGKDW